MDDFQLHQWFRDDELEVCPTCGERAAVKGSRSEAFVCLKCGEINFPDIDAEAQNRESGSR